MIEIIDVSGWQGHTIDFERVAEAGIVGAYIKATQGKSYVSDNFFECWIGFRAFIVAPGAYHFLEKDADPVAQADHFLHLYKSVSPVGALPPCLDVERAWGGGDRACAEASLIWLKKVHAETGVRPIVYTYSAFGAVFHRYPEMAKYKLFLANYNAHPGGHDWPIAPAPWTSVSIWQYTGKGIVPGIVGNADRSQCKVSLAELSVGP